MTLQNTKKKVVSVGNYRFTGKLLGKGNFAKVEEAIHTVLSVKVAVKIMDVNQIKEEYVIKNLCREAKIMSKLNHPCIAALYQTMQKSDNVYYLVTELVSGGDLCSFVKGQREGKLEERPTRIYARQFASALSHMHSLGIVHRDLKMENVMLNSIQTQIKIVDFGLSNVWSSNNPLRTHCGSPEYAAPELFVTGRHYGSEVDLWSLGIILYGMVLGQLPFVSSRCDYVTSQERRRQLVAKINKGLSSSHRRALAPFTPEFRHMLSRLLAADAVKRITTKELLVHPWITDKGRRLVRSNPIKALDSHWQAKIITEIGTLLQVEPRAVMSAIAHDPLGKVGGMFNILVHKHQMNHLCGDGITRTLPSLTILEIPHIHQSLMRGDHPLRISTARMAQERRATSPLKGVRPDFFSPRLQNKKRIGSSQLKQRSSQNMPSKKEIHQAKTRPSTVQTISAGERHQPQILDYRLIKTPNLRRRAYSAGITPTTNRNTSPVVEKAKPLPPKGSTAPAEGSRKDKETQCGGKKNQMENLKPLKKLPMVVSRHPSASASVQQRPKDVPQRIRTADAEKTRSQSAHVAGRKFLPATPIQQNRTTEKSSKLSSGLPAQKRATYKPTENRPNTNQRTVSRQKRENTITQERWERSPLAYGDSTVQSPRSTWYQYLLRTLKIPPLSRTQ